MPNPFKTAQFKNLQREWYAKLKDAGFEEIEDTSSPNELLNTWHTSYFQSRHTPCEFEEISQYYSTCKTALNQYDFETNQQREIWHRHCDGDSVRKIAADLNLKVWVIQKCITSLREQIMSDLTNFSVNLITIRPGTLNDQDMVYATWVRPFYFDNDYNRRSDRDNFARCYKLVINKILSSPNTQINIACLKSDFDVIIGYSVFQGTDLHWVYVKKAWRMLGIAKKLVPPFIKTYTHLTKLGDLARKPEEWVFDPFLGFPKETQPCQTTKLSELDSLNSKQQ